MANFGPQMAETGSGVWGTPANLRLGFVTAATSSPEANQTLHDVWPSPGLVYCIFIFGALAQWWNFARCKIHLASKPCLLLYWQHYCTALQQRVSAELFGMVRRMELQNFCRGCHLYSVGRPSDWASAHILVWHYFKMWLRGPCSKVKLIPQISGKSIHNFSRQLARRWTERNSDKFQTPHHHAASCR